MALTIDDAEVEELARRLAERTGVPLADAVRVALRERMTTVAVHLERRAGLEEFLREMRRRVAELPILDDRTDDEILGYDEHGLPT